MIDSDTPPQDIPEPDPDNLSAFDFEPLEPDELRFEDIDDDSANAPETGMDDPEFWDAPDANSGETTPFDSALRSGDVEAPSVEPQPQAPPPAVPVHPDLLPPATRVIPERSRLIPVLFGSGIVAIIAIFFFVALPADKPEAPDKPAASAIPTVSGKAKEPLFVVPGAVLNGTPQPTGQPADPVAQLFEKGVKAQQAGKTDEALAIFAEVLKKKPDAASAHLNMAVIYLQTQRPKDALPHLLSNVRLDPKNPAPAFQAAQVLISLKRPKEALEPLQQAVKLAPSNPQGRALLAELLMTLDRPQDAYGHWVELAKLKLDKGQAAFTAAAIAFERLKRLPEAEELARQSVELKNPDPRASLLLGQILATRKKLGAAEKVLVTAAHDHPNSIEIHTVLSEVRWAQNDKAGAIAAMRAIAGRIPAAAEKGLPLARVRNTLGRLLAQSGDLKGAAIELNAAVYTVPQDLGTRAMLAEILIRTGDRAGAATQLRSITDQDKANHPARLMLARVLRDVGRLKDSQNEYAAYLKAVPKDIAAITENAGVYEQRNLLPQAEAAWARLAQLRPEDAVPLLERGRILRKMNRELEAIKHYRHVLQIKPNDKDALIGLAAMEENTAQNMQALAHLRALVSHEPDYADGYKAILRVAGKTQQVPATLSFLKQQLARNAERRAAYDAVLWQLKADGKESVAREWVQSMALIHPKAVAPKAALAEFNKANPVKVSTPSPAPTKAVPQNTPTKAAPADGAPVPQPVP